MSDLLNESERRFTKKLCDGMIRPVMIEAFWEIWLEAKKEAQGKNTTKVFEQLLRDVKTWNSSISLKNSDAITKNQPLYPNLLAAVFVINVKILSAIRTDSKSKKITIKLPGIDVFTQRCYEKCAKDIYDSPDIIVNGSHSESYRDAELYTRFSKHIRDVIEDMIPTGEILTTYLPLPTSGDIDMDQDQEEEEPEVEEEPGDPVLPDEPIEGGLEFGKTPGGVDTTVTTNASLSVPVVPGMSVAPEAEQNLFDDAPTTIRKLP